MAAILSDLHAKFVLSINDHPEMRGTFSQFTILPVDLKYTVSAKKTTHARELLVMNF
jgi:hypothetical protein